MATEASGGGTPDLGFFLEVWVYIRGVGVGNKSGGPRGGHEVGARLLVASGLFWPISGTPQASSGPKMISVKFQVNWTPFDILFLRNTEIGKKQQFGLGLRLIG